MAYIKGEDRRQRVLFPDYIDEYVESDAPVVSVQYSPLCSKMLTLPLCLELKTKHYGKERQDRLCSCL